MKTVLIALATICFLLGEVHSEDKYTTKYDDVDINAVLNSERLLNGYVSCLLDRGACTPDAVELKREFSFLYDVSFVLYLRNFERGKADLENFKA